jgi:Tfp pilus assembly PilM family ATPase
MFSDTTDSSVQPSPDLNRALAEAMSENHPEIASLVPAGGAERPDTSVLLKWNAPSAGRQHKQTLLGIDYSPNQLTILEMRKSRRPTSIGLQTVQFEEPPGSAVLAGVLREFRPVHHSCVQLTLTSARAVVRQFRLPPVARRRRRAAAIWEAQKLIPFSLRESDAVFGLSFAPSPRKGWQVTLAAVPREDAYPILDAIRNANWVLHDVSIAGTHRVAAGSRLTSPEPATTVATVLWSAMRASFVVFHRQELKFHYDLGLHPLPLASSGDEPTPDMLGNWLKTLGKGVGEAFELYIGAHPELAIDRVELYGIAESVAPLVTDWQERFGAPVAVINPIRSFTAGLPDDAAEWLASKTATITTAVIAAVGTPTVDMTPAAVVTTRSHGKSARIARTVFLASVFAAVIWSGFLWMQRSLTVRSAEQMRVQIDELKRSPINSQLQQAALQLQQVQSTASAAAVPAIRWMPYFKSILGTLPPDARLVSLSTAPPQGVQPGTHVTPTMRLDGSLAPSDRSHALVYAEWFRRMERVAGAGSVRLVSDRAIDWKGQQTSMFSIEVIPTANAEAKAP